MEIRLEGGDLLCPSPVAGGTTENTCFRHATSSPSMAGVLGAQHSK